MASNESRPEHSRFQHLVNDNFHGVSGMHNCLQWGRIERNDLKCLAGNESLSKIFKNQFHHGKKPKNLPEVIKQYRGSTIQIKFWELHHKSLIWQICGEFVKTVTKSIKLTIVCIFSRNFEYIQFNKCIWLWLVLLQPVNFVLFCFFIAPYTCISVHPKQGKKKSPELWSILS